MKKKIKQFPRGVVTLEYILLIAVVIVPICAILLRVFLDPVDPLPKKILEIVIKPMCDPYP